MSSVDNQIVSIMFQNDRFERNIAQSLGSIDQLSNSLKFAGAQQGLANVAAEANRFDISSMAQGVDNISSKFSALGAIGFSVIQKLTQGAMDFASRVGGLLIDPILGGGKKRALGLEQAKFLFEGLGMDIESTMESALDAVRGTAFGLDAAAKAAAQMGGSGLRAGEEMTGALRGIAGIAAMTNSSYEEMADIFIASAGKGKVMSNELGRISHRGVNAAAALAEVWGKTEQEVRVMASEGEISFKMFAQGMDEAFGEHATKANETYTGSLANMKAALGRLGASFIGPHLEHQRDLFNALRGVIDNVHDAIKPLIDLFVELKGASTANLVGILENLDLTSFTKAIELVTDGIRNIHEAVQLFIRPVKEAFRDIFPKTQVSILIMMASAFKRFTEQLKMGSGTAFKVRRIFQGIFSALAIGIEIVKNIGRLFIDLFASIADAAGFDGGGVLDFFANIGDSLRGLKESLVESLISLTGFAKHLNDPLRLLRSSEKRSTISLLEAMRWMKLNLVLVVSVIEWITFRVWPTELEKFGVGC